MAQQLLITTAVILGSFIGYTSSQKIYCASYCNEDYNWARGFTCPSKHFCCGNYTYRYCCTNSTLDISEDYPDDVALCSLLYHWQMLLGSMVVMVLLIVIAACCCQCCNLKSGGWEEAARSRNTGRRHQHRAGTELATIDVPDETQPSFFDPSHPYAFAPPDYESLAKDPPAYSVIFGTSNPAFEVESGTVGIEAPEVARAGPVGSEELPPAYNESDTPSQQRSYQPRQGLSVRSLFLSQQQNNGQPSEQSSEISEGSTGQQTTDSSISSSNPSTAINQTMQSFVNTSVSSTPFLPVTICTAVNAIVNNTVNAADISTVNIAVNTTSNARHNTSATAETSTSHGSVDRLVDRSSPSSSQRGKELITAVNHPENNDHMPP